MSLVGRLRDHPVLNVHVKRIRIRAVGCDERLIETAGIRTVNQWSALFVINQQRVLEPTAESLIVLIEPGEPNMPLAKDTRVITLLFQHFRHRESARF